jgi:signal transduction histidine kinase/ActR/RegA family two-component response regulator
MTLKLNASSPQSHFLYPSETSPVAMEASPFLGSDQLLRLITRSSAAASPLTLPPACKRGVKRRREEETTFDSPPLESSSSASSSSSSFTPPSNDIERRISNYLQGKVRIFEKGEHEKRSLLSTLISNAQELQTYNERLKAYPELLKIFDELAQKSEHLFRLYNQALDGMSLKTPIHALTLEKEACVLVRSLVAKKGMKLVFEFPQSLSLMITDIERDFFQQLILNFVRNAVLHAEGATQITVRMEAIDHGAHYELLISIRDDGRGMPDSVLAQLFHSKERVKSGPLKEGSSGIGNSICKDFAETLNPWYDGIVQATTPRISQEPASIVKEYLTPIGVYRLERGTCCWFTLQVPKGPDLSPPTPPTPATPVSTSPALFHSKALLIDDNRVNLRIPERMLATLGYKVDMTQTGEEGVAKAILQDYDVIFIDMTISGSKAGYATGEEVATKLRGLGISASLVAFTADSLESTKIKCAELGMKFLLKPFTKRDLEAVLPLHVGAKK